ncbi:MAG: c-type cytochrome, partial [Planctomycetota bacterium]
KWLSCTSCHPDVRSDALNWDLANDGYGSPRSAKSLLYSHYTPPVMITGVRPDAETAVRAGFKFIQFSIRLEDDANSVDSFLKSVEHVPSPYLVNGQLSANAELGKTIFQSRCAFCHSSDYYTDMTQHDVGTGRGSGESLDTPTLSEVWRTAPYLQDGRAATMMDVLTTYNTGHFDDSSLSPGDLDNLAEYVLSLPEPIHIPDPNLGTCWDSEECVGQPNGDATCDGEINLDDLRALKDAWLAVKGGAGYNCCADFTQDETVNLDDLRELKDGWLSSGLTPSTSNVSCPE